MKRVIIAGTIGLLTAVLAGSLLNVQHTLLMLGSMAWEYDAIRVGLIILLLGLLFSTPPRSVHFRIVLAAVSAALFIGSSIMTFNYAMGLLDAVLFVQVAIIFFIEAAEAPFPKPVTIRKIPVRQV